MFRFSAATSSNAAFILSRAVVIIGAVGGGAAIFLAGGCSPAASTTAEGPTKAPLIVAADGTDISDIRPAPADPAGAATAKPRPAAVSPSALASVRPAPARPSAGARAAAKPVSTSAAASPSAPVDTDACKIRLTCTAGHDDIDLSAPKPDSAKLQAIMNGRKSRSALIEGQIYKEGDRFGASECTWTVAHIDAASARLEKAQIDRTFAVTLFVGGAPKPGSLASAGIR